MLEAGGYEDQAVVFQRHCVQRLHPGMKRKIAEILFLDPNKPAAKAR